MAHIYQDPPSRDMTAASERQAQLDKQIASFLAKGGEIKAFDPQRRPVEYTQWKDFSLTGSPPPLPAVQPKHQAPRKQVTPPAAAIEPAEAEALNKVMPVTAAPAPEPAPAQAPAKQKQSRRSLSATDERLAVRIIVGAAMGSAANKLAQELNIPLRRCRAIARQCRVQFHG